MSKKIQIARVKTWLILAVSAFFAMFSSEIAVAQTMGEYGMATGHVATNASQMPSIQAEPPSIGPSGSNGGGSTHTEEIRGYDEPAPVSNRHGKEDDSNDSNESSQDWVQVK